MGVPETIFEISYYSLLRRKTVRIFCFDYMSNEDVVSMVTVAMCRHFAEDLTILFVRELNKNEFAH